jgi:hypothetical protein
LAIVELNQDTHWSATSLARNPIKSKFSQA